MQTVGIFEWVDGKFTRFPLPAYEVHAIPRIGEWVDVEGIVFEVVMVGHSTLEISGSDIFVKRLGTEMEARENLLKQLSDE